VPEVVEDGETLLDNARLKARRTRRGDGFAGHRGRHRPGGRCARGAARRLFGRYAGEDATYADNVDRLLEELGGVPDARRGARFSTVALAAFPDGSEVAAEGVVEGTIADEARGAAGFGYDPVFVPAEGDGRTFAEMTPDEKHALSHRGPCVPVVGGSTRG